LVGGGVGLLVQDRCLVQVFLLLRLELLDLLRHGQQVFRLPVVVLIAMAAVAAAQPEQELAFINDVGRRRRQVRIRRVAELASRLNVLLLEQRPQPVLVIAVRLLHAGGRAPVALVTRRAAKLLRIVHLQQLFVRMADEGYGVLVRLLGALGRERCRSQRDRLADAHVAGFAPVHDVGVGYVDLPDLRVPGGVLVAQALERRRRQAHHVIGEIGVAPGLQLFPRLLRLSQFVDERRLLVLQVEIFLFQLVVAVLLALFIGQVDGVPGLALLLLQLFDFFVVVFFHARGIGIEGAALHAVGVGANARLHVGVQRQDDGHAAVNVGDLLLDLRLVRARGVFRGLGLFFQLLVLAAGSDLLR